MNNRVVLGMSGGVDSSVAAYILIESGYDVIGITMKLRSSDAMERDSGQDDCCSLSSVEDARRVCNKLNIPFYVLNFTEIFEDKVVKYFINEYFEGRTPNPCIACNKYIKFDALLKKAKDLEASYVATGHYAKIEYNPDLKRYLIKKSAAIAKDPMTALNPIMTIGSQLAEAVIKHKKAKKKEAKKMVIELLETVGVKGDRYDDYPHQFSGGMKQRVVIAMALLCNPEILIADEPTTALDVTIQAQVLEIISNLIKKFDMSMILITHDLGIVAETCDRVAIMYAGEIVESGTIREVYKNGKHPYTKGLFGSIPNMEKAEEKLIPIEGQIPNSASLPTGCYFHPRCKYKQEICQKVSPEMKGEGHVYKCHFSLF